MWQAFPDVGRILKRDIRGLFKSRRPIEVSLPAETVAVLDELMARYAVEIAMPDKPFCVRSEHARRTASIEGGPATSEDAAWYIPLFAQEFGFYPPLLVRRMQLRRIVLCGGIFFSTQPHPWFVWFSRRLGLKKEPLSLVNERFGGLPGFDHDCYFDVTGVGEDEEYIRKTIHHELYHIVQQRQFGSSGDPGWSALNRPGFTYGPGGMASRRDPTFWVTPTEEWGNGFLNHYSMSAPEEDQAEIFAHLLTEPARVAERIRTDDILRKKVERLKASLERICPAVNARFWQRVQERLSWSSDN